MQMAPEVAMMDAGLAWLFARLAATGPTMAPARRRAARSGRRS
jgi:hypothetical protein